MNLTYPFLIMRKTKKKSLPNHFDRLYIPDVSAQMCPTLGKIGFLILLAYF